MHLLAIFFHLPKTKYAFNINTTQDRHKININLVMTKNYVTELTRVTNVALRMPSVPPLPCCCHGNQHMYYRPALNPFFLALKKL